MLNAIEKWIDSTNERHTKQRVCCDVFVEKFAGYFPGSFLKHAYYVVVDEIPKPDFPELRARGLGAFMDMQVNGITYKNTYYLVPDAEPIDRIHFHELVHVAQWSKLGAAGFISRYMNEILTGGYSASLLEKMAYFLDKTYSNGGPVVNVLEYVENNL